MTAYLDHASGIQRIIHMRLNLSINGNAAMGKDGFGLVAADAVKRLHDKVEQLGRLLYFADNSLVVIARYAVVVSSVSQLVLFIS